MDLDSIERMILSQLHSKCVENDQFEENDDFFIFKFICSFKMNTINFFLELQKQRFQNFLRKLLFNPTYNYELLQAVLSKYNSNMIVKNVTESSIIFKKEHDCIPSSTDDYIEYLENNAEKLINKEPNNTNKLQNEEQMKQECINNNTNKLQNDNVLKHDRSNYLFFFTSFKDEGNKYLIDKSIVAQFNDLPIFAINFEHILNFLDRNQYDIYVLDGLVYFTNINIILNVCSNYFITMHKNKMIALNNLYNNDALDVRCIETISQLKYLIRYVQNYVVENKNNKNIKSSIQSGNVMQSLFHFPPCMRDCIQNIAHLKHYGRFQLTLFLTNIGFNINQIHEAWNGIKKGNDFSYQVKSISNIKHFMTCETIDSKYYGCFWKKYESKKIESLLQKWYGENDYSHCLKLQQNPNINYHRITCKQLFRTKNWNKMKEKGVSIKDIESADMLNFTLSNAKNLFIASKHLCKKQKIKIKYSDDCCDDNNNNRNL